MESMDLDLEEWSLVRNKMLRFHFNISEEIKAVVQSIRAEMRPELIPIAEEKANFGKEGFTDITGRGFKKLLIIFFFQLNILFSIQLIFQ